MCLLSCARNPSAESIAAKFAESYLSKSLIPASELAVGRAQSKLAEERAVRDRLTGEGFNPPDHSPLIQISEFTNISDDEVVILFSIKWDNESFRSSDDRIFEVRMIRENDFWKVSDFDYIAENENP